MRRGKFEYESQGLWDKPGISVDVDGDGREGIDKVIPVNLGAQFLVLQGLSFESLERSPLALKARNSEPD